MNRNNENWYLQSEYCLEWLWIFINPFLKLRHLRSADTVQLTQEIPLPSHTVLLHLALIQERNPHNLYYF